MKLNTLVYNRVMSTLSILLIALFFITPAQYSKLVLILFFLTFGGLMLGKRNVKTAVLFLIFAVLCFFLYR